jgi:plastocyanin
MKNLRIVSVPFIGLTLLLVLVLASCGSSKREETTSSQSRESRAAPQQPPPSYFKVDPATAGSITGKVTFSGKRLPRKKVDMDEDPQCQSLHKTPVFDDAAAVNRRGGLANVFVYVKSGLEGKTFEPPSTPVVIDQRGCWFNPRVLGIQTGQTLEVLNSDPVTHNIHPRAHINREWNQSQSSGAPPIRRRFSKQEVMIRVKCNIHAWMHDWIGVVDNPYFAVTGPDGSFSLKNLPPGHYVLETWQEELGTQEQQVTVPPAGSESLTFAYKEQSKS